MPHVLNRPSSYSQQRDTVRKAAREANLIIINKAMIEPLGINRRDEQNLLTYHSFLFYISKLLYVTVILYFLHSFSFSPRGRFVFLYNACAQPLLCSLNLLFGGVVVSKSFPILSDSIKQLDYEFEISMR